MKKLFFTLCALCLCGTMWGQDVTQDSQYKLYYTLDESNNATIVAPEDEDVKYSNENLASYSSIEGAVTIPEYVDNNPVIAVGASAFNGSSISGTFVIPAYIKTVGSAAFAYCSSIETVVIEESDEALIDENTTAYTSMFYHNSYPSLKKVEMYRNISGNYGNAVAAPFAYHWYISDVIIGEKVTEIANYMFRCYFTNGALANVTSYAENPPSISSGTFSNASSSLTLYTPYDYLNNYRLDNDWLGVFGGDNMHALGDAGDPEWPTDELAFLYNGLWYEPIYEEDGETETGNCVLIADQGGDVYSGTITIPETATNSETSTTYTVTRIEADAFANSSITGEVIIPANILYMGENAFLNCTGITKVTYEYSPTALTEENHTSQSGASFHGCTGIETVNWYRDIVSAYSVNGCQQPGPFSDLGTVVTLNIGPRVTELLRYAFRNGRNTTSLTTINCYAAVPPTVNTNAFGVLPSSCVLNVPQGSEDAYKADGTWTDSSNGYPDLTPSSLSNAYAVTISELAGLDGSYYATYYNDNAVDIYPQGGTLSDGSVYDVTTYAATGVEVEGETAYLDLVEIGATVPAKTAVLVDGNVAGTYTVIETTAAKSASYTGDNDLYGFLESNNYATVAPDETGSYYFYKLTLDSANDSNSLGFYWGASEGGTFTGEANKAYLVLTQNALQGLSAVKLKKDGNGDNDTTGITSVEVENETNTVKGIYTVQGVRVSNMNQPGLYIVDGKKVLKR